MQNNVELLNPDMPADELRLHMGELTADEVRLVRAAIRWANTRHTPAPVSLEESREEEGQKKNDRKDSGVLTGKE